MAIIYIIHIVLIVVQIAVDILVGSHDIHLACCILFIYSILYSIMWHRSLSVD